MCSSLAKSFRLGATVSAVLAMVGCATITGGSRETVSINSTPSDAMIRVDGGADYTTPASISLPRGKDHTIVIRKTGYKPARVELTRTFRALPTIAGNILWLLPGVIVDGFSGGMWKFERNHVSVTLAPDAKHSTKTE